MAKKKKQKNQSNETDMTFLLKIFLYFLLGSLWVRFGGSDNETLSSVGIPAGLLIGLYFAHHEHFQIDRKLEYVILFVAAMLSYIAPVGFVLIV